MTQALKLFMLEIRDVSAIALSERHARMNRRYRYLSLGPAFDDEASSPASFQRESLLPQVLRVLSGPERCMPDMQAHPHARNNHKVRKEEESESIMFCERA